MGEGAECDSLSYAVVEAVAAREDVEPEELEPRLGEVIDPDSLDRIFRDSAGDEAGAGGKVHFSYCGYGVTAYSDGRVDVST